MQDSMTGDDIDQLFISAEKEFNQHPAQFYRKMYGYLGLGYSLIFIRHMLFNFACAVLGIGIGLAFNGSMTRFAEFSGYGLVFAILETFLMSNPLSKVKSAKCHELTRADYPRLFAELDQHRFKQPAPPLKRILLTFDASSSLMISPRLLFLGGYQYSLKVSMEQLLVMSPEQMQSVLAHEWGHLVGKNERIGVRIGVVVLYLVAFIEFVEKHRIPLLLTPLQNLAGKLSVTLKILTWQNEYAADTLALKLTNRDSAAQSLVQCYVLGNWLSEQYWQPLYDLVRVMPSPDLQPFATLSAFLKNHRLTADELTDYTRQTMKIPPNFAVSHPTLNQRLTALDVNPEHIQHSINTAANEWFGCQLETLLITLDGKWQQHYTAAWRKLHQSNN